LVGRGWRCESYHAGLTAERRESVHAAFSDGELEIVLVGEIDRQRRAQLPMERLAERQQWRDRRLAQLVGHKRRRQADDANR
jgi:hypothetical protein